MMVWLDAFVVCVGGGGGGGGEKEEEEDNLENVSRRSRVQW